MTVAIWLGSDSPMRSIRWLDGALEAGAKFERAVAVVAGSPTWLDLAADRATRAKVSAVGVQTDLQLDYLGWAQIVSAIVRQLEATTVLVDEASRPERAPEVAALADLLDAAQLTNVVALAPDGAVIRASRISGHQLQTVRVRGMAVIGVRIAGDAIEDYPTPMPSASLRRLELSAIGLDPIVIGHRAVPPRATPHARKNVDRIAEYLALHVAPRRRRAESTPARGGR